MAVPTLVTTVSTGVTSASLSVTSPALTSPAIGQVIVVKAAVVGTAPTFAAATCSDTLGNTYTRRISAAAGNTSVVIFTAPVTVAGASTTITVAGATGTATRMDIVVERWTGIGPLVIDGTPTSYAVATGATTSASLPAIGLTRPNSPITAILAFTDNGGSIATGASNTSNYTDNFGGSMGVSSEYRIYPSAGSAVFTNGTNPNGVQETMIGIGLQAISLGPTITLQPKGTGVIAGQSATFSVTATTEGTGLSYQWRESGVNIPGATTATYSTAPLTVLEDGNVFDCVVTDSNGTITSTTAIISVSAPAVAGPAWHTIAGSFIAGTISGPKVVAGYTGPTLQTVSPTLFTNNQTFYTPTVTGGSTLVPIGTSVSSSASSGNVTLNKTLTAGSTLILVVSENTGTGAGTGLPTISGGGTWSLVVAAPLSAFHSRVSMWRLDGATAGATTITVAPNVTADATAAVLSEWPALAAVDKTASADNVGNFNNPPSVGPTATTSTAEEVVIAGFASDSSYSAATVPATGYSSLGSVALASFKYVVADYKLTATTGAQSATWGASSISSQWSSVLATFAAASSVTTLNPTLYNNSQTFYNPTVTTGAVTISPGLDSYSQTFYAPTVTKGLVTVSPTLYTNSQTFYSPTISVAAPPAQTIIAPEVIDSNWTSTVLAMHFDGDLIDATGKHTVSSSTGVGYATGKSGSALVSTNAAPDVAFAANVDYVFSNQNFTIEFWYKPVAGIAAGYVLLGFQPTFTNGSWEIGITDASNIYFSMYTAAAFGGPLTATHTANALTIGSWNHVAIVRSGTSLRWFINGNTSGTSTNVGTSSMYQANLPGLDIFYGIGTAGIGTGIDDLRITKGVARYTGAFTPTSYFGNATGFNTQTFYSPTVSLGGGGAVTISPALDTYSQTFYAPTVTVGAVTISPTLYTNSQTFYAPTVSPGAVILSPSLFTNSQSFYAPTVTYTYTLTASLHTNNQSFYTPTVTVGAVTLSPILYTNSQTFYAPSISSGATSLSPTLYTNSQTFYTPTVTPGAVTLSPTLVSNANTLYNPSVSYTVTASLYTNSQAFYAETVTSVYTLSPTLYSNNQTFYAPTVTVGAVTVSPTLYTNSQTFYSPVVSSGAFVLSTPLVTNTQSFYTATVTVGAVGLTVPLLTNSQSFYTPTLTVGAVTISPPLLTNTNSFGADILTAQYTLSPVLYTNTQTFYASDVTSVYTLSPTLYTNSQIFYAESVTSGVTLSPPLLTNTSVFNTDTITVGAVNLVAPLFVNSTTFYTHTITQSAPGVQTLSPSLVTNNQAFFTPTVTTGAISVTAPIISSSATIYVPSVSNVKTLSPTLLTNTNSFFTETISVGAVSLGTTLVTNDNSFFSATVTPGARTLTTSLVTNSSAFYAAGVNSSYGIVVPFVPSNENFYSITATVGPVSVYPALLPSASGFYSVNIIFGKSAEIYTQYQYITDTYSPTFITDLSSDIFVTDTGTRINIQDINLGTYV